MASVPAETLTPLSRIRLMGGLASAAFADHHGDVALFAAADAGVDPLHELRIRPDRGAQQCALVRVVLVPVVARQVLVVPGKLAGIGIQGNG